MCLGDNLKKMFLNTITHNLVDYSALNRTPIAKINYIVDFYERYIFIPNN